MNAPIQGHTAHPSPPLDPRQRRHLLAELDRRSAEIKADLRCMDQRKLPISLNLADIEDGGLRRVGGYRSLTSWAREVHHLSASTSSEWLDVGRACRRWPVLLERLRAERVCWSNARELVRLELADEDLPGWLEKAERLTVKAFQREVRKLRPSHARPLHDLTTEEVALFDAIVDHERARAGEKLPFQKALARFCKRVVQGGDPSGRASAGPTLVLDLCPQCREATWRTAEGSCPAEPGAAAAHACDARVLDVREGTGQVTRTIPAPVRRLVDARDKGRCVVPACTDASTQIHHLDGWEAGHDPKRLMTLCKGHHDQWHDGVLRTEGDMPGARFSLADGTFIGVAGDEERADVAKQEVPARACTPGAAPEVVEYAVAALRSLGLSKKEAQEDIRRVIARSPDRRATAEDLVQEALRTAPLPAGCRGPDT